MTAIMSERGSTRISEIDHALKRMDEADYGTCQTCGLEIAQQRLEAMPFTRNCRDCQWDHEREAKTKRSGTHREQEWLRELGPSGTEDEIS
ncbi:MAG: TraR/DksA C4-type zinc finger protein, partial [Candidatus Binataceae bacterium]|jgi:RNA polymerase-binding transcription factor DksA